MRILTCKTCHSRKMETDFYRQRTVLGLHLSCKECVKERARNYRAANLEYVKEYDRQRGALAHRKEGNKARAHRYDNSVRSSRYTQRHPEKRAAQVALGNAVRDGRVTRQDRCEKCNSRYLVQGHHEDYSKHFDVVWLCAPCHGARHREINAERRAAAKQAAE